MPGIVWRVKMHNKQDVIKLSLVLAKEVLTLDSMCRGNIEDDLKEEQLNKVADMARLVCCDDGQYNPLEDHVFIQ